MHSRLWKSKSLVRDFCCGLSSSLYPCPSSCPPKICAATQQQACVKVIYGRPHLVEAQKAGIHIYFDPDWQLKRLTSSYRFRHHLKDWNSTLLSDPSATSMQVFIFAYTVIYCYCVSIYCVHQSYHTWNWTCCHVHESCQPEGVRTHRPELRWTANQTVSACQCSRSSRFEPAISIHFCWATGQGQKQF